MEFKDKALVTSLLEEKQEVKMGDRVLIVDSAGKSKINKKKATTKVNKENKKTKKKPAGTLNATSVTIIILRINAMLFFISLSV